MNGIPSQITHVNNYLAQCRKRTRVAQGQFEESLENNDKNYCARVKYTSKQERFLQNNFSPTKQVRIKKWLHGDLVYEYREAHNRIMYLCKYHPNFTEFYEEILRYKFNVNVGKRNSAAGGHLNGKGAEKALKESGHYQDYYLFYGSPENQEPITKLNPKKHTYEVLIELIKQGYTVYPESQIGDIKNKSKKKISESHEIPLTQHQTSILDINKHTNQTLLSLGQNRSIKDPKPQIRNIDNNNNKYIYVSQEGDETKIITLIPPEQKKDPFPRKFGGGLLENLFENQNSIDDEVFNYVFKTYQTYRQKLDHHKTMSLSSGATKSYSEWIKAKQRHGDRFPTLEEWKVILTIWITSHNWSNQNQGGRWMPQFFNFLKNDGFTFRPDKVIYNPEHNKVLRKLTPYREGLKDRKNNSQNDLREGYKTPSQPIISAKNRERLQSFTASNFRNSITSMVQEETMELNINKPIDIEAITQNAIKRDIPKANQTIDKTILAADEHNPVKRAFLKYQQRMKETNNE